MVYHTFFLCLLFFATVLDAFDHEYRNYEQVLERFVDHGRVEYASLKKDRNDLDDFVKEFSAVTKEEYTAWSRDQQQAFWINAYNAWTLRIVIDHYPIGGGRIVGMLFPKNSIQRIPGVWDDIKIKAAGRQVSLNDIEHKILRPVFKEPRIHFSIVCASIGCPLLRSQPFRASLLKTQLEEAARDFIEDPAKVKWDAAEKVLRLSRVFDWFSEDFDFAADSSWRKHYSKKQAGSVAFVGRYVSADVAAELKAGKVKINYLDFDWTLNSK